MAIGGWVFGWSVAALLMATGAAIAGQLSVDPILLQMNAPTIAGALTLRNDAEAAVTVQTRVLRWSQNNGKETLIPATDVVASPPAIKLVPNADYVVRIVRVSKAPVAGEESYRVIVDQLPDLREQQTQAVSLLIRQSIPVFFDSRGVTPPSVSWSFADVGGKVALVASNAGDMRLRIASLSLRDGRGRVLSLGNGLLGYALGHASMSWVLPSHAGGFGGGAVSITAETEKGPLNASAQWRGQ
jgi:fimbrial chaperone protein